MLLYLANSQEDVRIGNVLLSTKYLDVFKRERETPLVAIGAFCLMPNHFHILATPLSENGIPRFMLKLQTGYSMYFNTKNERKGSLFQGPYRGVHVDNDRYLKYLYSYIHLNPAKLVDPRWKETMDSNNTLVRFVEQYPYSSYGAYLADVHTITDPARFPEYFSSRKDIKMHITDWLVSGEDENA